MATINPSISIVSYDGKCPNPDFNFSLEKGYDQTATLETPQVVQLQDINYYTNDRVLTSLYVENLNAEQLHTQEFKLYKSGAWTTSPLQNATQQTYLSFFQSCINPSIIYVCTEASQEDLIPDKSTTSWIYRRLDTIITSNDISDYRYITSESFKIVPLFSAMFTSNDGASPTYTAVGITNTGTLSRKPISSSTPIDLTHAKVANVYETCLAAGELPPSTEERVTKLESQVAKLTSDLSALQTKFDTTMRDLPAIISAVSSDVSKLYVAR